MTIDKFVNINNLPEMKLLGEMKNFRYWIEKNLNSNEDTGIPMVVCENKNKQIFEVCDADAARAAMQLFS